MTKLKEEIDTEKGKCSGEEDDYGSESRILIQ